MNYTVSWNRPKIFEHEPVKSEAEGGFKTLEEAEKFADEVCREWDDAPQYQFQVHQSIKITPEK